MGMIYYYREYEGADAHIRCERGEDLLGMTGDRYYKNVMSCYLREKEAYPIYVHFAGEEYASPDKAIVRLIDRRTTWMHFVCGGKGIFNGQTVQAGDAFVAWVNDHRTLISDPDDPLHFYWIGVSGINHPEMLVNLGFEKNDRVFRCPYLDAVRQLIGEIVYTTVSGLNPVGYQVGKLMLLLAHQSPAFESPIDMEEHYTAAAKQIMRDSQYQIPVEDVAKKLGISRKHLCVLFRRQTNGSVRNYILEHRKDQAKSYLLEGYSPKNVGVLLGYSDYAAFFNFFKKNTGQTPTEYVRNNRNKKTEAEAANDAAKDAKTSDGHCKK